MTARWHNNGMVFCVSTLHFPKNKILRLWRRPCRTQNNRAHVDLIWGEKDKTNIKIPTIINDYNHWMGDVDVADQRIAYYHPSKLVCYQNWFLTFLEILSIIRNNSYIVHWEKKGIHALSHKDFIFVYHQLADEQSSHGFQTKQHFNTYFPPSTNPPKRRRTIALFESIDPMNVLSEHFPHRYDETFAHRCATLKQESKGTCLYCNA